MRKKRYITPVSEVLTIRPTVLQAESLNVGYDSNKNTSDAFARELDSDDLY